MIKMRDGINITPISLTVLMLEYIQPNPLKTLSRDSVTLFYKDSQSFGFSLDTIQIPKIRKYLIILTVYFSLYAFIEF